MMKWPWKLRFFHEYGNCGVSVLVHAWACMNDRFPSSFLWNFLPGVQQACFNSGLDGILASRCPSMERKRQNSSALSAEISLIGWSGLCLLFNHLPGIPNHWRFVITVFEKRNGLPRLSVTGTGTTSMNLPGPTVIWSGVEM